MRASGIGVVAWGGLGKADDVLWLATPLEVLEVVVVGRKLYKAVIDFLRLGQSDWIY